MLRLSFYVIVKKCADIGNLRRACLSFLYWQIADVWSPYVLADMNIQFAFFVV